jgi:predicted Zn-dependent peptidase
MIEDLVGFFNNKNYEQIGGGKNKIKKTKLLLYEMNNKSKNTDKLMNTLLIPLANSNTITVGIFIRAGSRQETNAFGIAHFLEHMTFKGTTKISSEQLMIDLDSIGAQYNAMTGHEFTLYYISGNPDDIELLLNIIIDLYLDPTYPIKDIEKEKNVVLEELRMNNDNNHRQLTNKLYKMLFENTDSTLETLSRPIIGYKDTIKDLNRDDILNYRKKNYIGSNCLLCVSGNFNRNDVISIIEKGFNSKLSKIKFDSNLFKQNIKSSFEINSIKQIQPNIIKYIHIEKDINQTIINFVFNAFDTYNSNNFGIDLICDILSNGFSSRLFNLLRNKMGVSYYNNTNSRTFNDIGQVIISVGVDHVSVLDTIREIINELKQIKLNGITETELEKAKKQNETSLLFHFKDPFEYLMHFGMNYLIEKPLYNISTILELIKNIKLVDINTLCHKIFNKNNFIIGTIGKVPSKLSNEIIQMINSI